jgi:hypothetical protein
MWLLANAPALESSRFVDGNCGGSRELCDAPRMLEKNLGDFS